MISRISQEEAQANLGEWLRRVREHGERVIVEREGVAQAMLVPVGEEETAPDDPLERAYRVGQAIRAARVARLVAAGAQMAAEQGSAELPDPVQIVHEMREERDEQLWGSLGVHRREPGGEPGDGEPAADGGG